MTGGISKTHDTEAFEMFRTVLLIKIYNKEYLEKTVVGDLISKRHWTQSTVCRSRPGITTVSQNVR